jgi:hypothetical protein
VKARLRSIFEIGQHVGFDVLPGIFTAKFRMCAR